MGIKIRTIRDIRSFLSDQLKEIYPEPEIKAMTNIILKTVTGSERLHHLALPEQIVSDNDAKTIIRITGELRTGKPLQYVLGETTFYGFTLKLSSDTLIPRPETEELTDIILRENRGYAGSILDACTGSGCIAIALAANLPGSSVSGFDISEGAVKIASENAKLNSLKVNFFTADVFSIIKHNTGAFGIIVSNPPYVRETEKQSMAGNVLDFEPHRALFVPDSDPLKFYRALIDAADTLLEKNGRIYFEINEAFGNEMSGLLTSSGYTGVLLMKDMNGRDRFIKGEKNG